LFLDVFQGPVLGEHALALAAVTYVFCREHQKIRSKPGFQQSLIVLAGLAAYEVLLFFIDGYSGHSITNPLRWVHILSGAIVWPLATAVLGYRERRS
jgi:rod shape-determining protein MreD